MITLFVKFDNAHQGSDCFVLRLSNFGLVCSFGVFFFSLFVSPCCLFASDGSSSSWYVLLLLLFFSVLFHGTFLIHYSFSIVLIAT